jgi:hypothetical protein
MIEFHRLLNAGRTAAEALAHAQRAAGVSDPAGLAAAAGFVCVGADVPVPTNQVARPRARQPRLPIAHPRYGRTYQAAAVRLLDAEAVEEPTKGRRWGSRY